MSLEQKIEELTAAVEALTKAMQAGGTTGASKAETTKGGSTKTTTKAEKPKPTHTVEEAQAALLKLKDDYTIAKAKKVLAEHGIDRMANIKADQADAVFASAEKLYAELSEGGNDDGL